MTPASGSFGVDVASRRGLVALILTGLAAAIAVGVFHENADFTADPAARSTGAISDKVRGGMSGMKSLADMLLGRSPGERAAGALASLKHKRTAAPHERALPKIRRAAPTSPLASIVAPAAPALPGVAEAPPQAVPLYNLVSGSPATAQAPPPSVFPAMPPPPAGGGFVFPPVVTQVIPPPSPLPLPVPEPGSWGMMLIGFALIGMVRRASDATEDRAFAP